MSQFIRVEDRARIERGGTDSHWPIADQNLRAPSGRSRVIGLRRGCPAPDVIYHVAQGSFLSLRSLQAATGEGFWAFEDDLHRTLQAVLKQRIKQESFGGRHSGRQERLDAGEKLRYAGGFPLAACELLVYKYQMLQVAY
jgi:hypothetical protein